MAGPVRGLEGDRMADHDGYRVGDVANGHVLTEQGWWRLHDDGATSPAYQPDSGRRSRTGLWVTLVVAAIVVVGIVGGVVLTIAYARRPGATSAPEVTSAATPSSSTTTVEPTPSEPSTTAPPETSAPASEGKLFAFSETASLSFHGIKSAEITIAKPVEFSPTNPVDTSARGRLVYVPVLMKVVGKEKASINPYDFEVVLPDGEHLDVAYVTELPKDSPTQLRTEDVDPGKTVVASIPFDVPAGVPLKVAYTYSGQVLGTWH